MRSIFRPRVKSRNSHKKAQKRCQYGSVRGAPSNRRSYRDIWSSSAARWVAEQVAQEGEADVGGMVERFPFARGAQIAARAAFTLAVDDRSLGLDRFIETAQDTLEMVGLNYHAHVSAKIGRTSAGGGIISPLTQRERQCLAWISDGKTMQDIANDGPGR